HVVMEPLAMLIGFRYYLYLKKKKGDSIQSQNRIWIILGAALGAVVGSRLIGGLENIPQMLQASNKWLYFYQNKTVLGGFLGGVAGVETIKKMISEKQNSGDLFVYPILLALIIGRIGCFSMGVHEETYGLPSTLFTGMDLGDGFLRHPVTLYEIAFLIILWIVLKWIEKGYWLANGLLFKLFIIAYCVFRLLIDFIKPHYSVVGLSIIQLTCITGLLYYLLLFFMNKSVFSFSKK
ncbi:MAG TPA: prolipoprotein diacylglyceryl transferase family protein, partial [Chitinophagaceae bacterium]|nr:prolipoprotein diacylglyceryl transferase family protein [Chitinophagaceae bacterium]